MASASDIIQLLIAGDERRNQYARDQYAVNAENRRARQQRWMDILGLGVQTALAIPQMRAQAQERRAMAADRQSIAAQRAFEMQQKQRSQQMDAQVNQLVASAFRDNPDGTRTVDRGFLGKRFAEMNIPLDKQSAALESLSRVDESLSKFQAAKREHAADVLHAALEQGGSPDAVMMGIAYGKANGWLTDAEIEPIYRTLVSGQDAKPVLAQMRDSLTDRYRPKEQALTKLGPNEILVGPGGAQVAANPVEAKPPAPTEASLARAAAEGDKAAAAALGLIHGPRDTTQAETARHNRAMEAAAMARANRPDAGAKPKSVTSGDAGRIAEIDNSIRDVGTLTESIGRTGAASGVGAALPNWVTEATGIGSSAKQRQAVIDRVKQVIGKALEGGVLRKEDEEKYKKILPVISDSPEVAKAKLSGLNAALRAKKQILLESLDDAGYDTSRFRARESQSGGVKVGGFTVREK